eukprot:5755853-Pyramimonas_sp.AAC.1
MAALLEHSRSPRALTPEAGPGRLKNLREAGMDILNDDVIAQAVAKRPGSPIAPPNNDLIILCGSHELVWE